MRISLRFVVGVDLADPRQVSITTMPATFRTLALLAKVLRTSQWRRNVGNRGVFGRFRFIHWVPLVAGSSHRTRQSRERAPAARSSVGAPTLGHVSLFM